MRLLCCLQSTDESSNCAPVFQCPNTNEAYEHLELSNQKSVTRPQVKNYAQILAHDVVAM